MGKRTLVEFIVAWLLIILSCVIIVLPIFNVRNVKNIFISIIALYGIIHLIKNLLIMQHKDYTGFSTAINSVLILVIMMFLDINDSPWNLALVLFIWVILMSLTKLKESDYYHDRKNKLWKLNVFNLLLFIIAGVLTTLSLYYTADIQILIMGFFFMINGILELMDPVAAYIIEKEV